MSKYISELLDAPEPMFSMAISQLEEASGNPSLDVRLTAEIIGKTHLKMRELGLDPKDTTGKELYAALLNLVAKHDAFLCRRLGGEDPADVADVLPRVKMVVERLGIPKQAWVLRHSVAKRLMKAHPPRNLMKQLGYRSLDSMLKREPIANIFASFQFSESLKWYHEFLATYRDLRPSDFETRKIEIVLLEGRKWHDLTAEHIKKSKHNIVHLKELGAIVIMPLPVVKMPGVSLITTGMVLNYINEIRLYSAFFKMQQVKPHFGKLIERTLKDDPSDHLDMAGQRVHWRIIQRHFGHPSNRKYYPEIFEPHVQPEDLQWRKAEEVLYHLEPALHFWHDMDYVARLQKGLPISLNLMDVAINYANGLGYGQRMSNYFQEALWNEVCLRYIAERPLETQVLRQLDNDLLEPEMVDSLGLEALN